MAQTSALLVLEPIFEADLQPEQYAYRPERSAHDAVRRVHSLLNRGLNEVVDCDLANYFGEIPHAQLLKSLARRISDGRMLRLIKAWLEMPVEEDDGKGGTRRTNRARKERKGTPQGSPISPLASNLYMRRFILGWKVLGHAQRFRAEIVNYADDLCVLGKAPAAEMLTAVERLVAGLKLPVNERKTRCLRCPEEPLEFLGYRIGRNYRPYGKGAYIGTRPSKASVQSICRRISNMTARGWSWRPPEEMVESLNRSMTGWANYFGLGQVSPADTRSGGCAGGSASNTRRGPGNTCASRTRGYQTTTASLAWQAGATPTCAASGWTAIKSAFRVRGSIPAARQLFPARPGSCARCVVYILAFRYIEADVGLQVSPVRGLYYSGLGLLSRTGGDGWNDIAFDCVSLRSCIRGCGCGGWGGTSE